MGLRPFGWGYRDEPCTCASANVYYQYKYIYLDYLVAMRPLQKDPREALKGIPK